MIQFGGFLASVHLGSTDCVVMLGGLTQWVNLHLRAHGDSLTKMPSGPLPSRNAFIMVHSGERRNGSPLPLVHALMRE